MSAPHRARVSSARAFVVENVHAAGGVYGTARRKLRPFLVAWVAASVLYVSVPAGAVGSVPGPTKPDTASFLRYEHGDGRLLSFQRACERVRSAVCIFRSAAEESDNEAVASGVLVHPRGILLTCFHVIRDSSAAPFWIQDGAGRSLILDRVLDFDIGADWAILKVHYEDNPSEPTPFVKLGEPHRLRLQTRVFTMGNPLGLTLTCSEGRIQHLGREFPLDAVPMIQHDVLTAPGSSGSGLFTFDGALVGVVASASWPPSRFPETRFSFAVPIEDVRLPSDTTGGLSRNAVWSFLAAYSLVRRGWDYGRDPTTDADDRWIDWVRVEELLQPLAARLDRFPEAALLAARADLELHHADSSLASCKSVLRARAGDVGATLLLGATQLRLGDTTAARTTWGALRHADSILVRWQIRESRLFWVSHNWMTETMAGVEDSLIANAIPDSVPQWPLDDFDSIQRQAYDHFGVRGLKVLDAIMAVGADSDEVCRKLGVGRDFVRQEVAYFADKGLLLAGDASADTSGVDTTAVCRTLARVYRLTEARPDGWTRSVPIIQELLRWCKDPTERASALADLGEAYYMLDRLGEADSVLTEAIETAPEAKEKPFEVRANVRLLLRQFDRARRDVVHARELLSPSASDDCDRPCHEKTLDLLVTEACVLLGHGRRDEARALMTRVIEQEPRWREGPVAYPDRRYSRSLREAQRTVWQELVLARK